MARVGASGTGGVGSGTVTSVALTVPAFLSIAGSPVTTSGTLAISLSGVALPIANGGTGQTTKVSAFNGLSPITSVGDLIIGTGVNTASRLGVGANNYVLTSNGTTATWATTAITGINQLTGDVVAGPGTGSQISTIQAGVVSNAKLALAPALTIKGNNTGGVGAVLDLTPVKVTAMLVPVVGDSGTGGTAGIVPTPGAGTFAAGDFLAADGTWSYVDQSKTLNSSLFSLLSININTIGSTKYQNIQIYTGITGKQYALVAGAGTTATATIYDITNQLAPVICSSTILTGSYNIYASLVSGKIYAYVGSSGSRNLYIYDITNPYHPVLITTFSVTVVTTSLYDIEYINGFVYLATQNQGLVVIDVGNGASGGTITAPVVSFVEGGGVKSFGVTSAVISGTTYVFTTQYVTSVYAIRQIKSWSITTPQTPSLIQSLQVTSVGQAMNITISGNTAVVGVIGPGVYDYDLIDVTAPSAMTNLSHVSSPAGYSMNSPFIPAVSGNYMFAPWGSHATYGGQLQMFDITNRSAPVSVSSVVTNVPNSVFGNPAIGTGYIFVSDYGAAPGSLGSLDVFTMPAINSVIGSATIDYLTVVNGVSINSIQSSVLGSVSGSALFTQPDKGASYKKIMIYCNALNGTASYVFPTPFIHTPVVVNTSGPAASVVTSISVSGVTVTGGPTTGFLILEGF